MVLAMERFKHLGFLIQFGERGSEGIPLSQAAPFFANLDLAMSEAPVLTTQVHGWLMQIIADSLVHITERASVKESGSPCGSNYDQDVAMTDASPTSARSTPSARGLTFIEGVSKSSYLKQETDLNGSSIKAVRVEHCERVHVISVAKRICIANYREYIFFLGVNHQPLIVGYKHKLQGLFKRETRFTSKCSINEIISKIEQTAGPLGFGVKKNNFKLQSEKLGRKGQLAVTIAS